MPWTEKEFSEPLQMMFSYHTEQQRIMTEDKTVYNKGELDILLETGLDRNIHNFKKVFKGEIVELI